MMRFSPAAFLALPALAALTGCAVTATEAPNTAEVPATAAIHGTVYGGQTPVASSTITLYAAGTSGYGQGATVLATTTADAHSNWSIASYTCPYSNTPTYVVASGGTAGTANNANLVMIASTGPCSGLANLNLNINEVTTAATAYALAHFFPTTVGGAYTTDLIGGTAAGSGSYNAGLVMANATTINTLINLGTGTALATNTTAGLTTTLETTKLNHIANILAACVNSNGQTSKTETTTYCGQLFNLTSPSGATTRPLDTLQAAVQMALYPYRNVTALYNLPPAASPFVGLTATPNDWTLGISYSSAAFGLSIAGSTTTGSSSNLDIDASGNIWFPTNISNSHGIANFNPTANAFNGPYGTAVLIPQYITIDNAGSAYVTDTSSLRAELVPVANPTNSTLSDYTASGPGNIGAIAIAPSTQTGFGILASANNTYLYAKSGSNVTTNPAAIPQAPSGMLGIDAESDAAKAYSANSGSSTSCTLSLDQAGSNPTVYAATASNCYSGGIAFTGANKDIVMAASSLNQLCDLNAASCFSSPTALNNPQGIASDGDGAIWIANAGNASITTLGYAYSTGKSTDYTTTSPISYIHNTSYGKTLTTPYGLAIDRSGNVWISNAGCVNTTATACTPGAFVLSELIGAAAPTTTPLSAQVLNNTVGTRPTN